MSVDFSSPFSRGVAGSNLNISVSPLGLVELSDEEFEVNGPRLSRYSVNWAFYLGRHWAFSREIGEDQLTFNYVRAMTDYLVTFTFGRGVDYRSPKQTEAIVPSRLKRLWEVDNDARDVLHQIAQMGGVSGDSFVKVAYEEPYTDTTGRVHPGRVRILPLNSAHVMPEFHPHDRSRFLRVKIKYRFYGTSPDGARQVFTYTEILTDSVLEEYINDELISQRENPLGVIPIVYAPNRLVSGSPWGLADCHDIMSLNRTYNEIATQAVDIINYHSSPVTVVIGAKASNLEKGAKKVWAIPTAGASVQNLELGHGVEGIIAYMAVLKTAMHEMTGVPESALGQFQPISNTSGVALSIQFQPLMQQWRAKVSMYGPMLEHINQLALMTLFLKEPEMLAWNPETDSPIGDGQMDMLDPTDPLTYQNYAHFPPPLPIDRLIVLNEIQLLMGLKLESRRGALRVLGEAFPDEKLEEIRSEQIEDAKIDGAMSLLKTSISKEIMDLTGMMPGADGAELPPMQEGAPDALGQTSMSPQEPQPAVDLASVLQAGDEDALRTELVTRAYGTRLPQRRSVERDPDGEDDSE